MHGRGDKPARKLHLGGMRRNACKRSRRLIARRSQVQILPPLLRKALETGPFADKAAMRLHEGATARVRVPSAPLFLAGDRGLHVGKAGG